MGDLPRWTTGWDAEINPADTVGHEIIYAPTLAAWESGPGIRLTEAIVDHGFDALKLTEISATAAIQNKASSAVLRKTGFTSGRDVNEDDGAQPAYCAAATALWP